MKLLVYIFLMFLWNYVQGGEVITIEAMKEYIHKEVTQQVEDKVQEYINRVESQTSERLWKLERAVESLGYKYSDLYAEVKKLKNCSPCATPVNLRTTPVTTMKYTSPPRAILTTLKPTSPPIRVMPKKKTLSPLRPARLPKPVMDLDLLTSNRNMTELWLVESLPDGKALVMDQVSNVRTIHQINKQGDSERILYTSTKSIEGLLSIHNQLYVLLAKGPIVEIQLQGSQRTQTYSVDGGVLKNSGSLAVEQDLIPDVDLLLLADPKRGEVFTYKLSTKKKEVRVTGLWYPTSVTYASSNDDATYIVCERGAHVIRTYNASWNFLRTIGGQGHENGQLIYPYCALMSRQGTILVADRNNHRVSEFTTRGRFIQHLLLQNDGLYQPYSMSFSHPYLWVVYRPISGKRNIKRYKLYDSE